MAGETAMLPLTPTKLGRYEIVDEIGKGAMGVVYLARDPLIGRLVALKTFRIGYSVKDQEMEQFRIRFMREAQSAGILTHPNIVTIHDVVEDDGDGLAFIAMEYVRGTNLKLIMQAEQPLSPQFVLDIMAQVGDALDYAHSNRVVHRDVKPANILITADNRIKITDFGIARLDSSNLTQEGQLLGTPNYMAPEQILGKEIDHRADLFSLGVVLYEMFTRHKPFQGENLTVVSHRIVYDHFTPPRDYVGELAPGVDRILTRALEKDPARRYQRARDMVDDLRRLVEATTVARDDLNETQSLSSTMALPPTQAPVAPQLPPLPVRPAMPSLLSRWRSRSAAPPPPDPETRGSTASTPPPLPAVPPPPSPPDPLADTVATAAPPPPAAKRFEISPRWLLVGGGTAALVLILGGAAIKLARDWSQPAPARQSAVPDPQAQARIAELVNRGSRLLQKGEFEQAVEIFRQAERLDPSNENLRRSREIAELQVQEYKAVMGQEQEIAKNLAQAKTALASRAFEQAAVLATLVLGVDPKDEEAAAILEKARQGMAARQNRQRTAATPPLAPGPGEDPAITTPVTPEAQPAEGAGEPASAAAASGTVRVYFKSDLPEGVLIVWVKHQNRQQEILRQPFSRGGFLQRFRGRPEPYEITRTLPVPAGIGELIVHVAPKGKPARRDSRLGNFPAGSPRILDIHLSESSQLTVSLN